MLEIEAMNNKVTYDGLALEDFKASDKTNGDLLTVSRRSNENLWMYLKLLKNLGWRG